MQHFFVLDAVAAEPVFTQYRHNAKGAIKALTEAGGGVAIAALHHPEIGDIDLRWGHTSDSPRAKGMGLAKLVKWHPEALSDLQAFIGAMTIQQRHKNEIHLKDEANGRAGVKVDWDGTLGHWLVTAFVKSKKEVYGSKGSPAALDSLSGLIPATPDDTDGLIMGLDTFVVNLSLDDTGAPDVAAMMARMKLTSELGGLRKQIAALGDAATDMLTRLKLAARSNQIRKELGASLAMTKPEAVESPYVLTLKAVSAGQHDTKGLPELYGLIQEAVNGLDEAGLLTGDADAAANEAITHWAELEERLSAHV